MREIGTHHIADEDESYFVSMTDLMVGMLFIFIIMLMAFALNFREAQEDREKLDKEIHDIQKARTTILKDIQSLLKENYGIDVKIDIQNGILRLPEEILFEKAKTDVNDKGLRTLKYLADVLLFVLPCYSNIQYSQLKYCHESFESRLEAVLIEGHTDIDPMAPGAKIRDNLELSAIRAVNTYRVLMEETAISRTQDPIFLSLDEPLRLQQLKNDRGEQLIGVSGYGEKRPLPGVDQSVEYGKRLNRRIDLRFLMATPKSPAPVVQAIQSEMTKP